MFSNNFGSASLTETKKVLCTVCNKAKGIYTCGGCSQIFCPKHPNDHREELNKQLEGIITNYDTIHQNVNQQAQDPRKHSLMMKIKEWEEESIEKIHQAAEKARNDLLNNVGNHVTILQKKLKIVSAELKQGREDNDFSEIDLRQWTEQLEQLTNDMQNPKNLVFQRDSMPLVTNIRVDRVDRVDRVYSTDIFECVCNDAKIEDNGRLVTKNNRGHTEVRGKNEYTRGEYTLRFRIEKLPQNGWILLGIISKTQPMRSDSYLSASNYGWSNQNQTYTGVSGRVLSSGKTLENMENDTITLRINCDQRTIQLQNARLQRTLELSIDLTKCPFPWQLHLNLHEANTEVRILD